MSKKKGSFKAQVTLNEEQIGALRRYKGILGSSDSEIIRFIISNWLLEKNQNKNNKE